MDHAPGSAVPIDAAELASALAAIIFGILAASGLLGVLAATHRPGAAAPVLVTPALASESACAAAPSDPLAMRLGRARVYASPIDIALEPAPFSLQPPLAADQAYRRSGQHLSGCETEELLAFYSSASPPVSHVLAWVLVSTLSCPSATLTPSGADGSQRQCLSISPVDASSGVMLGTRSFQLPQ